MMDIVENVSFGDKKSFHNSPADDHDMIANEWSILHLAVINVRLIFIETVIKITSN